VLPHQAAPQPQYMQTKQYLSNSSRTYLWGTTCPVRMLTTTPERHHVNTRNPHRLEVPRFPFFVSEHGFSNPHACNTPSTNNCAEHLCIVS
jgi:hypothetical protein